MARILMVVASRDFRDEEYLEPRKAFDAAGHVVTVASSAAGPVRGTYGTWVTADRQLADCRAADFDAVVWVGGEGAREYWDSRVAHRLCREVVAGGKVLAALCLAPGTLARAGVLADRAATAWPAARPVLEAAGAVWTGEPVTVHAGIVTADGPMHAKEFALAVLKRL